MSTFIPSISVPSFRACNSVRTTISHLTESPSSDIYDEIKDLFSGKERSIINVAVDGSWVNKFIEELDKYKINHTLIKLNTDEECIELQNSEFCIMLDKGKFFDTSDKYILVQKINNGVQEFTNTFVLKDTLDPVTFASNIHSNTPDNLEKHSSVTNEDIVINTFLDIISLGDKYKYCKDRLFRIFSSQAFISQIISFNDKNIRFRLESYTNPDEMTLVSDEEALAFFGVKKEDSCNKYRLSIHQNTTCDMVKI